MPSLQNPIDAWAAAERELALYLRNILGIEFSDGVYVGDELDLTGRCNIIMVQIVGGDAQEHGYTSGANTWATRAEVVAQYIERAKAQRLGVQLMRRANFPKTADVNSPDMTHLQAVFPLSHPTIERRVVEIANQSTPVIVSQIKAELRAVYTTNEE